MKIGIIGCGLIGRKRALSLQDDDKIVACCDTNRKIGLKFSEDFNCKYFKSYKELLKKTDCDIIIVSVVNKYAREISSNCLKQKKHVLLEKPMGRNYRESQFIFNDADHYKKYFNKLLKVGFNHRFHPAISKAKELFDSNSIGNLLYIRGVYGHGGRPGMEKEWRASKDLCGGGELLDQGVHLIDLSLWFAGDIKDVFGRKSTKFWNIEVEDNVFMLLTSTSNVDIQLHVSWTNWKNTFQFELYGDKGYLKINGLGGSYGEETLEFGLRKKEGGVPDIKLFTFDKEDISWKKEWIEFKSAISENRNVLGDAQDGLKANKIIEKIYESTIKKEIIKL